MRHMRHMRHMPNISHHAPDVRERRILRADQLPAMTISSASFHLIASGVWVSQFTHY
jgi:hypothetical protein